jgi:hypothetical protein
VHLHFESQDVTPDFPNEQKLRNTLPNHHSTTSRGSQ